MKVKTLLVMVFVMALCFFCGANRSEAYAYPQYLNGDNNYILVYGHMNYGIYLDKSSVKVASQNENGIMFTVDTVSGHVLRNDDSWIIPATDLKRVTLIFTRLYADSWETIYIWNSRDKVWRVGDLSNTYGYNLSMRGTFIKAWWVLTGTAYPNV